MSERLPRNMMKRGGVYYVRVQVDGRDVWRSTGHTTIKSAISRALEITYELKHSGPVLVRNHMPTFAEWVQTYKKVYTVRKKAAWRDEQILKPALAAWGKLRLDQFTRSRVVTYLNERLQVVAPSTLNRERGTLQAVFQRAIEEGLIDKNPFLRIPKEREGPRIRILKLEDEKKLREHLTPLYNRWLTFMLGTGLRLEEARAITPELVDWEKRLISVPEGAAKGGRARQVPLWPEVEVVLKEQIGAEGKLWHSNQQRYREVLAEKAVKAGIPHLSPHDLRHSFATRYLQGNGDIYDLAKILGHASVTMTEKHYAHLQAEDLVELSKDVNLRIAG